MRVTLLMSRSVTMKVGGRVVVAAAGDCSLIPPSLDELSTNWTKPGVSKSGQARQEKAFPQRACMEFTDKTLVCQDCSKEFLFSAAEQTFFASKSFQNVPKHCRECRAKKAGVRAKPGRLTECRVICAQCGVETVVPFLPRKNLAVYCRDCFQLQPGGRDEKIKDQAAKEPKDCGRTEG